MCRVSSAQEDTVAESLFREGREAMKGEELDVACPKFAESYRLDPALGTLFNLALCEEKRGRLATAWTKFRQFVDMAPTRDGRASMAWSHIKALEPRLPRLQLMLKGVQTRDALVHLDGVELRGASFGSSIAIDPGSHVVTLTIALQIVRREQFEAHADRVVRIELAAPGGPPDSEKVPLPRTPVGARCRVLRRTMTDGETTRSSPGRSAQPGSSRASSSVHSHLPRKTRWIAIARTVNAIPPGCRQQLRGAPSSSSLT
jgi:hypothetical protein